MTQVSRYGHMLKVSVTRMTMHVKASFRVTGSVLDDTIDGEMLGAETTLALESPDPPDRVARVVRNAERGCFVMQALLRPVPVTGRTLLNRRAPGGARPSLTPGPGGARFTSWALRHRSTRAPRRLACSVWEWRRHTLR